MTIRPKLWANQQLWPFVSSQGAVEAAHRDALRSCCQAANCQKGSTNMPAAGEIPACMIHTGAVIRRRVVAQGRVQGVFFRDTCRREARGRRVSGWVTNREDGAVEAVFEGEAVRGEALIDWARRGPPQA